MNFLFAIPFPLLNRTKEQKRNFLGFKKMHLIVSIFLMGIFSFASTSIYAQNEIAIENAKAGNPSSEWDISGVGDLSIQGFATQMSVNKGETVYFKIKTNSASYSINIYRTGYYNGLGARKWGAGTITTALPQTQPDDLYDPVTGKTDCSNWNVSAKWAVPANAVSGIYYAKLTRNDGSLGSSHIIFIVRNDAANSDILFKTSDATWQAYNNYGGTTFYGNIFGNDPFKPVNGSLHANKLSYNRPFYSSKYGRDCYKSAEYPMVRWLERNGYDVSYATCVDFAKEVTPMNHLSHKALFSVGHDEYWSATERNKFEQARDAGVNLGFFSGNTCFWKTRWEDNYRTLVCYKEGSELEDDLLACGGKCDLSTEWTGLWRSGCAYPAGGACKPENLLVGQIGSLEGNAALEVPDTYKNFRFWRNTSIPGLAVGQKAVLANSTIGFEFENDQYSSSLYSNGRSNFASFYPPGRIAMSNTTIGRYVHKTSMFKYSSGALIFASGSIQWSWGLDGNHDRGSTTPDIRMQQATVNLFADMGIQPYTMQPDLIYSTLPPDTIAPKSVITTNFSGNSRSVGKSYLISGTATDEQGVVAGVEISVDGGLTWQVAEGTTNWSYSWVPGAEGNVEIKTRALDDFGNVETPAVSSGDNFRQVFVLPYGCPCSVFKPTDAPLSSQNDKKPVEAGFKFRATEDGIISKIKFYKKQGTQGYHIGSLWTRDGVKLTSETFTNETPFGWQEVVLSNPVNITAGVTYVASTYNSSGDYVFTRPYFKDYSPGQDPIYGLKDGEDGPNGVGEYALNEPAFPTGTYLSSNYFIDVVFDTKAISIAKDPVSTTVCNGTNVSFFSAIKSGYLATIQWQKSTDGINWVNIPGATDLMLNFIGKASDNGSKYRAVWTNSFGSATSSAAILTVRDEIVPQISVVNQTCLLNGAITINNIGAVNPILYSLNDGPFQSNNTFSNLTNRTYSIKILDGNGCSVALAGINVLKTSELSLSLTAKADANCNTNDGAITVSASCGTPPYNYILSNGTYQSSGNFRNLSPGTYDVWVVDANSASQKISGILIEEINSILLVASNVTQPACSNADGSITVSASGGQSKYQYKINNGNYQTGNTFNSLAAGNYIITVKDAKGCTKSISLVLSPQQSTLALSVSDIKDESCNSSNGSISVLASGGKAGYQYSIDGVKYQSGNTFSNLSAGKYSIMVKDSKGCTALVTDIIIVSTPFTASVAAVNNVSCNGKDGSIVLSLAGGISPFNYSINGGKYNGDANKILFNLAPGAYTVSVRDNKNCIAVVSNVVVGTAPKLTVNIMAKSDACKNINNGTIIVDASGGIPGYQYSLNGGGYKTANVFTNLSPGTYNVTVKDESGCTDKISGITISRTTEVCSGRGGSAETTKDVKDKKDKNEKKEVLIVKPGVSIYPNPARRDFNILIKGMEGQVATIRIISAVGKEILQKQVSLVSPSTVIPINIGNVAKGLYYVNIVTGQKILSTKLVVQ